MPGFSCIDWTGEVLCCVCVACGVSRNLENKGKQVKYEVLLVEHGLC